MKDRFILVSKDAMPIDYLPVYGNKYWSTPNIDAIAKQGTVFRYHYTAAPSTAMAFTSMFTGLYPYQMNRKKYVEVEEFNQCETLFDALDARGYTCHIIWSNNYIKMAERFSKCYGKNTIHHDQKKWNQSCGQNVQLGKILKRDDELAKQTYESIVDEIEQIDFSGKVFVWIHLPHCLLGRAGYGDDIDLLDDFIGYLRGVFGDDGIYISADHGHMNGTKNKICYGFDVYESAIHIPFISPRIDNLKTVDYPTSNAQLKDILLNNCVEKRDVLFSDSAYYAQHHRKLAIIQGNMKYIYNKASKSEEMYDVNWDPNENMNLANYFQFDPDRKITMDKRQLYFYPHWAETEDYLDQFRKIKDGIWKDGTFYEEKIHYNLVKIYSRVQMWKQRRRNK